ncbi:MAG: hypothetical protein A4S17_09440 [Proteobacteria bacterium HN_bin10]|nr:MAG: hypothetical protein A4S17_09440 [Proteobacteria bacterium HN_bin10]
MLAEARARSRQKQDARRFRAAHLMDVSSLFIGALAKAPDDRYRRFAFLARFFAALRGAFLAVFLAFLAFAFLATFLAAFFAFLAMPWLLL